MESADFWWCTVLKFVISSIECKNIVADIASFDLSWGWLADVERGRPGLGLGIGSTVV